MTSNINKIETSLINSIADENLSELLEGVLEGYLDTFLEDGVLQNIPIIKNIYNAGKAVIAIRDQHFARKVLRFLKEISDISLGERQKFIRELEQESGQKAGEVLVTILDRFDNIEKAKLLANLFIAKVNGFISINKFLRLASIIDRSFLPDLKKLSDFHSGDHYEEDVCEVLFSLGLLYNSPIRQMTDEINGDKRVMFENSNNNYIISNLGKDILEYGLNIVMINSKPTRQA